MILTTADRENVKKPNKNTNKTIKNLPVLNVFFWSQKSFKYRIEINKINAPNASLGSPKKPWNLAPTFTESDKCLEIKSYFNIQFRNKSITPKSHFQTQILTKKRGVCQFEIF